jgi:hypothetical protein
MRAAVNGIDQGGAASVRRAVKRKLKGSPTAPVSQSEAPRREAGCGRGDASPSSDTVPPPGTVKY